MKKQYKYNLLEGRYVKDPMNYPRFYAQKLKLNVFVLGGALWGLFALVNVIA